MSNNPSVLFICTANQCRSPMAEYFFKDLLKKVRPLEIDQWRVESAGTWAELGAPAATGAKKAMAAYRLDLSEHQSQEVTKALIERSNLILVMEYGHLESLRIEFPQFSGKIFLLSEMTGAKFEVSDPMGGREVDFQATARQIHDLLEQGQDVIFRLACV